MRSLSRPDNVEDAIRPVESEVKQQVSNAQKYKEIIKDEKDLTELLGTESSFDIEEAFKVAITYYNLWKHLDIKSLDRFSLNDKEVSKHLKADISQDRISQIMSVSIEDFPNESGYFMLWEVSISDSEDGKKVVPVFVNEKFVLRPMAGKKIMDVFLNTNSLLHIRYADNLLVEEYDKLEKISMEYCYTPFSEMRDKHLKQNKESYEKYMYAMNLRTEAAEHIGIENIRTSKLAAIERERLEIENRYKKGQQVCPDFRLVLLVRLEA